MELTDAQKRVLRTTVDYVDGTSYVNTTDYRVNHQTLRAMTRDGLLGTDNYYDDWYLTPAGVAAKKELEET